MQTDIITADTWQAFADLANKCTSQGIKLIVSCFSTKKGKQTLHYHEIDLNSIVRVICMTKH